MRIRKFIHFIIVTVCLVVGLVFALSTTTIAGPHTTVIRATPITKSELPALPSAQTRCLPLAEDCGDGEGDDEWSYICERGDYQAWFGFDVSEVPDDANIQSIRFTALMYTEEEYGSSERTLWYDPDDSWIDPESCPGDKGLTELVDTIIDPNNEPEWQTFNLDLSQHDWKNDLADNHITLMLTGPYDGSHRCGYVYLSESGEVPCLRITYGSATAIPTLNEWGATILALIFVGSAFLVLRKRMDGGTH